MTSKTQSTQEILEALRIDYASTLNDKLAKLKAAADLIVVDNSPDMIMNALSDLSSQAHKLAGSAGSFGFSELGVTAKNLELFCQSLIETESTLSQGDCQEITNLIEDLIPCRGRNQVSELNSIPSEPNGNFSGDHSQLTGDKTILLVEDDLDQSTRMEMGLSAFGYEVVVIDTPEKIKESIDTCRPSAIILDLEFAEGRTAGAQVIREIRSFMDIGCPLIILTVHSDFNARLAAVRAGCNQFLVKPISLEMIIQVLQSFLMPKEKEQERVLVIDDDPDVLGFVTTTLQSASMIVEGCRDPSSALDVIEAFYPEIILLDLRMPECSGKELAEIIRQSPENEGIPIVYFSTEADKDAQMDAMSAGADDFLTKPINPRHLISAIRSRIERFRVLKNLMSRDSLTGLYNHATTWQLFDAELSRARRSNTSVSFAMLDIDHFKSVNDTLGHGAGDTVLKALSEVLTHRLRKGDIVGRLGGEEFGVVLPSTPADQAHSMMESIRQVFAEISQIAAGASEPITLSCGIAAYPDYETAVRLANAADQALYEAKASGRNKTVIASLTDTTGSGTLVFAADPSETSTRNEPIEEHSETLIVDSDQELTKTERPLKDAIVMDDDPMICAFVKPFAEHAGFRVVTITDPELFATTYSRNTDLIILDLNMPVMDGIQVLRFLGENRSKAAILIISGYDEEIVSAARSLANRQGLNILGALSKPFDQGDLERVLEIAYDDVDRAAIVVTPEDASSLPTVDELRDAIANESLDVYLQPKVQLPSNTVYGAEALVRWHHPTKGFIPPDYFIPIAEQNHLIDDLTFFVLNKTCSYLKPLLVAGQTLTFSVNISDRSFGDLGFPEKILDIVNQAGLSSSDIILELTETSLSADTTHVMDVLTRLRMKGFETSIDDFGTGHSSLSRLNDMPFNELKIDKSFVGMAHANAGARAIVKNTIDLAHGLGLKTVAEGAETEEHVDMLVEFGCDLIQGYFISRPLSPKDFFEWLKSYQKQERLAQKLTATGSRHLILYVEDDPVSVKFMETALGQFTDIKMLSINSAELGVELARKHKPDLILMETNLPEMDGYEALERLRVIKETRSIPVVAVTTEATNSDIMRGRHAGFDAYMTKPFDVHEMTKVVKEILEG